MVKNKAEVKAFVLLLVLMMISGCQFDASRLALPTGEEDAQLLRVQIFFTDGQTLIGYVKDMAINNDSKVYVGGSSTNYLYDAQGNIIGAFNYQRVLYMLILPAETKP